MVLKPSGARAAALGTLTKRRCGEELFRYSETNLCIAASSRRNAGSSAAGTCCITSGRQRDLSLLPLRHACLPAQSGLLLVTASLSIEQMTPTATSSSS